MIAAPIPADEDERLKELYRYEILDSPSEEDFNQLVELASAICQAPISLVSLIDKNRQWFKAKKGIDLDETPRELAFCAHAILQDKVFIVENALLDERFYDNPFVINDGIRFYAGIPLKTRTGKKLGTLCILDTESRDLTPLQHRALEILGRQVMNLIELRLINNKQQKLIELLQKQKQELKEKNDFVSKALKLLAHDIRGPLTSINGILDLISNGYLHPTDETETFKELSDSVRSTLRMVNDTLKWSLNTSNRSINLEPLSLKKLVDEIVKLFQLILNSKNITLINDIPADIILNTDRDLLEIILRNIIQNATKFTQNGKIHLAAVSADLHITIKVKDTGCGMTREQLDAINTMSEIQSTFGTHGEKGTGFGLKMCFDLVKMLGGKITAYSEPGKGSEFAITLYNF
ncbi:GAF domain-containing sensor histidine kinase [Schleiferia thermophila]|jgi:signal transduction histidine kinase|uniref:GAF domain-containing sensor histidine kinase n=1 Tax=Schleiferia thermophila TaxID=884107 RepID=UPI0004E6E6C1|nr:HAMP domain-containing sensor histidine kinase [Schleiferia thermophila]KFD39475.1 chemotaxis protein CheY [Schleiferia thermophila str. Yellowstone]